MDKLIHSKLGKLRILCALPLFSDSICLKRQSAAEHGFAQVILSMILAPQLHLSQTATCELIELAIFAEFPKVYLGDPSFYLRERHQEVKDVYSQARGRIWTEVEEKLDLKTSRSPLLFGIHEIVDAFAARLYAERESLLGNQFFKNDRQHSFYSRKRAQALEGLDMHKNHPVVTSKLEAESKDPVCKNINWVQIFEFLDTLFDESQSALASGGIGEYSSTFIGMFEKLKEHYRYKGWDYHYDESVSAHSFQVLFLACLLAHKLKLSIEQRIDLYHLAAFHDFAEAYASDVIYPIKIREKDMGLLHKKLEHQILETISHRFKIDFSKDPYLLAIVELCDRFSAELYFDRERRSGNSAFQVPNCSLQKVRDHYEPIYPEIFKIADELWLEYENALKNTQKR
jgi:5'-deoxynucleotidase YfbR-like HD superfamily hydrolase